MVKKINLVGIIIGVLIIGLAIATFLMNIEVDAPNTDDNMQAWTSVGKESISSPSYEFGQTYGGDAYTGIQQAAAQTANNLIPVFNAIEENSDILIAENRNLQILNKNNAEIADAETDNLQLLISVIKNGVGSILLVVGLCVIAKNISFELQLRKKEVQVEEADAQVEETVM